MFGEQWLSVIKAEREREIRGLERERLVDRNRIEEEVARTASNEDDRSSQRIGRPAVQPRVPTTDSSL